MATRLDSGAFWDSSIYKFIIEIKFYLLLLPYVDAGDFFPFIFELELGILCSRPAFEKNEVFSWHGEGLGNLMKARASPRMVKEPSY